MPLLQRRSMWLFQQGDLEREWHGKINLKGNAGHVLSSFDAATSHRECKMFSSCASPSRLTHRPRQGYSWRLSQHSDRANLTGLAAPRELRQVELFPFLKQRGASRLSSSLHGNRQKARWSILFLHWKQQTVSLPPCFPAYRNSICRWTALSQPYRSFRKQQAEQDDTSMSTTMRMTWVRIEGEAIESNTSSKLIYCYSLTPAAVA